MSDDSSKRSKKAASLKSNMNNVPENQSSRRPWTEEEDRLLNEIVRNHCKGSVVRFFMLY